MVSRPWGVREQWLHLEHFGHHRRCWLEENLFKEQKEVLNLGGPLTVCLELSVWPLVILNTYQSMVWRPSPRPPRSFGNPNFCFDVGNITALVWADLVADRFRMGDQFHDHQTGLGTRSTIKVFPPSYSLWVWSRSLIVDPFTRLCFALIVLLDVFTRPTTAIHAVMTTTFDYFYLCFHDTCLQGGRPPCVMINDIFK